MSMLPETALATTTFRLCTPRFANARDAISGNGAFYDSGRYHVRGAFRIVYTATSLDQAWQEYFHTARHSGFSTEDLLPITAFAIKVQLARVLDVTDRAVQGILGLTSDELLMADWTIPQQVGQRAFEDGFEALLVPSRRGEPNLNILVDNLLPDSVFEIRNVDRLPVP